MIFTWFFVFQCAVRSFFPELYNVRIVFFDHWMNSVFIGRGLATIGEVTWIAQVGASLVWCHEEMVHLQMTLEPKKHFEKLQHVRMVSIAAVVLCSIAECCCNYAMFTLDYFPNVIETSLWTVAMGSLIPYSYWIWQQALQCSKFKQVDVSSIKWFAFSILITCASFVL